MKKVLCVVAFLVLAAPLPLWSDDQSPHYWQVLPEAVWAAATGGGTWVTQVQITNFTTTAADINVYFYFSGGNTGSFLIYSGLDLYHSVRYSNILATIDAYDIGGPVYYGKGGAVWFWGSDSGRAIE